MTPDNLHMLRRDYIESRKNHEAAKKRLEETQARFKECQARLLDFICNGNQQIDGGNPIVTAMKLSLEARIIFALQHEHPKGLYARELHHIFITDEWLDITSVDQAITNLKERNILVFLSVDGRDQPPKIFHVSNTVNKTIPGATVAATANGHMIGSNVTDFR